MLTDLQRRTIASLDDRLERLAMLPSVVARLAALDADVPGAAQQIVALSRCDPPFALRLLRLANAANEGGEPVDTIPGAIDRIGAHNVAGMILALSVMEVFVPRTKAQRNLWIHSIQTAITASRIAARHPELKMDPEVCFLAGLLHDIGRFVIFEHRPDEMAYIDEADAADPRELIAAERAVCGFDHAELGHEISRRWRLPESVSEMVRVHHCYGDARRRIPPEVLGVVELVQEADCLSFCLLRHSASLLGPSPRRDASIDAALHLLRSAERAAPAHDLIADAANIDREARILASVAGIAYQ